MQFIQCFGSSTFLSLMCDNYYHIYCQHYTPKHAGDALWVFHTDKAINNFLLDLICSGESAQLAGISGGNWWDIQTKQNKDKPGNAMLPGRILSEKQTNKKFAGTLRGEPKPKFASPPSSLLHGNSAACRKMTRSGHRQHHVLPNRLQKYLAAAHINHLAPNHSDTFIFSKAPLKWKWNLKRPLLQVTV